MSILKIIGIIALLLFAVVFVVLMGACVAFLLAMQDNELNFFNDDDLDY